MQNVILFAPCLVDQLYPEMGIALVKLLQHLGFGVSFDSSVTCCGQPAFNAGQVEEAKSVARRVVRGLSSGPHAKYPVVCPSGSCTAMIRKYYPEVFHGERDEGDARALGARVFELSEFLRQHNLIDRLVGTYRKKIAFHNSCHSARELELRSQYRELFDRIDGVELIDPSPEPVCCGFGGLFCQKFQGISQGMAKTRLEMCRDAGAEEIVSNDPGCIMHLRTMAAQQGFDTPIRHTVELLVDAIGV
ncbi:MAG: (Fe-S)-binding protein [Pseudomonadota bacterium]|jgi:L-lactate dehydrogenase complex protein LldE